MYGKEKSLVQVNFMERNSSPEYKLMYRRDGKGDKYLDITKVLDTVLDRLDAIEDKLNTMEQNA